MLRRAPSVGGGSSYYRSWGSGGEAGSCTENLGSESGDVGCDADEIDHFFPPLPAAGAGGGGSDDAADVAALCGEEEEEEEEKRRPKRRGGLGFPPAMPRASGVMVLRAERRGDRLILTEVRADEHERRVVFRADRRGGRLRLRFANDDDDALDLEGRGGDGPEEGAGSGGVAAVAVQHTAGGGGGGGGELCQVAAGRSGGVEVGAVVMGTT